MNAAFLLVTSAWLAGGQAPTTPATPMPTGAPPAAQVAPAPAYGGGCSSCGSSYGGCGCSSGCNDCEKPGLLDRLRARFAKNECGCGCAPTCSSCAPAPVYHATPTFHGSSCGSCCSSCSSCDSCDRPSFFERLRARFHRDSDCGCSCDSGCATGGCSSCGAAPLPPAKVGEQIQKPADAPLKLPSGDKPTDKPGDKPTDKPGDKPTDKSNETSAPKNIDLTPTGGDKIIDSGTKNPF